MSRKGRTELVRERQDGRQEIIKKLREKRSARIENALLLEIYSILYSVTFNN
jgi:hypothetical protein